MRKLKSSKESYLGCAKGYLQMGRPEEAKTEILECFQHYGSSHSAYELMIEAFSMVEDWQALVDFGYSQLNQEGKVHDYGWVCVIRGLLRSGKAHLALRAARSARVNCGERNAFIALESLRVLALLERYHAARKLYLQILVLDPASAAKVIEDIDFCEFMQAYVSGDLSDSEPEDDPWANDGSEVS